VLMDHTQGRAAIYVRISRDKVGQGLGVARQEQACRDLADRLGITVGEVFTDNDKSATSGKPRPAYLKMCDALAAGRFSHVLAWSNDRLQRDLGETFAFGQVVDQAGVTVETVTAGTLDFVDPEKRVGTYVLSVLADAEVARRKARMLGKHRELAEAGRPTGGPRTFGFEADHLTVRESEAEVLRELARRILDGESVSSLCRDLDARGITTSYGNHWRPGVMRRMLESPRLIGVREHRGERFQAAWPAILDKRTHAAVARRLRRRTSVPTSRSYMLTGLLVCGECQRGMVGSPNNGHRAYFCALSGGGCGRSVRAESVERFLPGLITADLDDKASALRRSLDADEEDSAEIARRTVLVLEADLRGLAEDHGAGLISRSEWLAAREPLTARLDAAQASEAALSRPEASASRTAAARGSDEWLRLWRASSESIPAQRAMLGDLLARVEVGPGGPGPTFRPERFRPVWR
jgi:site-specific DNA recombinase